MRVMSASLKYQHEEQGSAYALQYLRQGGGRAFVLGQVGGWEACRVWKGN